MGCYQKKKSLLHQDWMFLICFYILPNIFGSLKSPFLKNELGIFHPIQLLFLGDLSSSYRDDAM